MAPIQIRTGSSTSNEYEVFPADTYYCRIAKSEVTESKFKDKDGNAQFQLALVWEVSRLTAEQEEADLETGKWFRQWFSLYYGETQRGPSQLKTFVDSLSAQGLIEFDPDAFDPDALIGIEQRVSVGVKFAQDGREVNQVLGVAPLKMAKKAGAKPAPAPAKNAPQHVAQAAPQKPAAAQAEGAEDDELF